MDVSAEVATVTAALALRGSAERAAGAKAYLKSDLDFYGVDARGIRATARQVWGRHPDLDRDDLADLVRGLWQVPTFDVRAVAVGLMERRPDLLEVEDLDLVEEMLRASQTWALVDWLATKVAAPVVERHPDGARRVLERWAGDDDFWLRRASLLALLPTLRRGDGEFGLFARLAEPMLGETEFFIRKAVGWVLREVAKRRPELTLAFLTEHIDLVSGLTLREAAKYLPDRQRRELLDRRASIRQARSPRPARGRSR